MEKLSPFQQATGLLTGCSVEQKHLWQKMPSDCHCQGLKGAN